EPGGSPTRSASGRRGRGVGETWFPPRERAEGERRSRSEVVRVVREILGTVLGDEDEVLEAAAAEPRVVEPGLDRHDVSGHERVATCEAHARLLVHLQPDAVAEAVEEAVLEHLARLLVE